MGSPLQKYRQNSQVLNGYFVVSEGFLLPNLPWKVSIHAGLGGFAGPTIDWSDNAGVVTRHGYPGIQSEPSFPAGRALYLPGSSGSNWVTIPNIPQVRLTTADWSAEITIKPATASGFRGVGGDWLGPAGASSWRFYTADNLFGCVISNKAGAEFAFTLGETFQAGLFKDGNTYYLTKNGVVMQEFTTSWVPSSFPYPLVLGTNESYTPVNFQGHVADFRITQGVARHTADYTPASGQLPKTGLSLYAPKPVRSSVSPLRTAASSAVSDFSMRNVGRLASARDTEFGGAGRIWGTTKAELSTGVRVPTKARVSILRERDKLLAREVWSDPVTGEWEVRGLDTRQGFIELAQDPDGNYMPAAADRTLPEEAP